MSKRYPRSIMATACVPWTTDFKLDEETFRAEIQLLLANRIRSIYLFGTAGEGHAVSNRQFTQISEVFLAEMKKQPDSLPMIGVISLSMSEMIERIKIAYQLGARDFQISFPSWGALSDEESLIFFHQICDRFADCRFMHYNNGPRAKKKLGGAHYLRLVEEIPNLVAVKNPTAVMHEIHELMDLNLPLQFFFMELGFSYASLLGECSLLISLLNLNFDRAHQYFNAGIKQDMTQMVALNRELKAVHQALFATLPGNLIDGAYDKLFVKPALPHFSQSLYPPYLGVSDDLYAQFIARVRQAVPHWDL